MAGLRWLECVAPDQPDPMYTTCPNCTLILALTANDLRVGQGYVRCGRCGRVFNALISLTEEQAQETLSGATASGTSSQPLLPEQPEHQEHQEQPETEPDAFPFNETPPGGVKVIENRSTGTFETIVLEGESFTQTEEMVDQAEVEQQLQQIADRIDAGEMEHVRAALRMDALDAMEPVEMVGEGDVEDVVMETSTVEEELDADAIVGNPRRMHWYWTAGAVAAALLLLVQMVHHSRQQLVAQEWAQPALTSIYSMFGVTLEPSWDLAAYDLRQLGGEATPESADHIVVRASVHNRASHSQPMPMIRVRLQDRFGNSLATHAIEPLDYLHAKPPSRMKPDQRMDVELIVEDPNHQAVGFELDACLPDAKRQLHCSNDL
jgi:predicted Zn finger-like uncharacterized protein